MKTEREFLAIGAVSRTTGIPTHVLRYWEREFPRLKPLRDPKGRRLYHERDIALIEEIKNLVYKDGYRIRAAKRLMRGEKVSSRVASKEYLAALREIARDIREIEKWLP